MIHNFQGLGRLLMVKMNDLAAHLAYQQPLPHHPNSSQPSRYWTPMHGQIAHMPHSGYKQLWPQVLNTLMNLTCLYMAQKKVPSSLFLLMNNHWLSRLMQAISRQFMATRPIQSLTRQLMATKPMQALTRKLLVTKQVWFPTGCGISYLRNDVIF